MVYIDKKYPSQHGSLKNGLGKAFSILANITMVAQIICLVVMWLNAPSSMANLKMESFVYLWNTFMALIIIAVLCFCLTFVFCHLSKKVQNNLIAPTYLLGLNGVYFVVSIVALLVYIF